MDFSSIWLKDIPSLSWDSLKENKEVDILIIGGGLTGLSLLYELKKSKLKIILVEQNKIGHGVTSRSTAKVNYLQGNYAKIKKEVSLSAAKMYLKSQKEAISRMKEIIKKENIDCDFEKVRAYLYSKESECLEEYRFLKDEKINVSYSKNVLSVSDTYVMHPLKYLYGLAKAINPNKIFENTKIIKLQKTKDSYIAYTDTFQIKAKKVVLANHYPFFLFPFFMPIHSSIEKSYLMAYKVPFTSSKSLLKTTKPELSKRYLSLHNENYEILLSETHETFHKVNDKEHFQKLFSNHIPKYAWSNEDLLTPDYMPYIGKLKEGLYLATGYNTWGMTNALVAALLLKDILLNKPNPYQKYFDPYRSFTVHKGIKYVENLFKNSKSFIQNKLFYQKAWYPKKITFERKKGHFIAAYEENGRKFSVTPICPHMGCTLIFNEFEKTWDCPCHASKFDIKGKCLNGPSQYDISYKED